MWKYLLRILALEDLSLGQILKICFISLHKVHDRHTSEKLKTAVFENSECGLGRWTDCVERAGFATMLKHSLYPHTVWLC